MRGLLRSGYRLLVIRGWEVRLSPGDLVGTGTVPLLLGRTAYFL